MQSVVILGRGGAGKSTFAKKLGGKTGLPVVELDKHFWQPGLTPTPREQVRSAANTGGSTTLDHGW